ncbi:hypothetical protein HOK51_08120 [Candidatus Woesearchaeota archaeon]|jgi:hypothetical protein|nr:hypothetical protein [Candidatus Woesearchaeota archaeon]MBT6519790.1 hypothetical protein [Candidatus Woesearchaeota archaeon]MBT7368169.1 hypothetical protein [Candidatus Woesearchaeota archaeon]
MKLSELEIMLDGSFDKKEISDFINNCPIVFHGCEKGVVVRGSYLFDEIEIEPKDCDSLISCELNFPIDDGRFKLEVFANGSYAALYYLNEDEKYCGFNKITIVYRKTKTK